MKARRRSCTASHPTAMMPNAVSSASGVTTAAASAPQVRTAAPFAAASASQIPRELAFSQRPGPSATAAAAPQLNRRKNVSISSGIPGIARSQCAARRDAANRITTPSWNSRSTRSNRKRIAVRRPPQAQAASATAPATTPGVSKAPDPAPAASAQTRPPPRRAARRVRGRREAVSRQAAAASNAPVAGQSRVRPGTPARSRTSANTASAQQACMPPTTRAPVVCRAGLTPASRRPGRPRGGCVSGGSRPGGRAPCRRRSGAPGA